MIDVLSYNDEFTGVLSYLRIQYTITQKWRPGRSDLVVVFTVILCGTNFLSW